MNDELLQRLIDVLERVERHLASQASPQASPRDAPVTPGAVRTRKWREKKASEKRHASVTPVTRISLSLVNKKEASKEGSKKEGSKKEPRIEIEALGKNWPRDFREQFWAAYPKKVEKPYALKCLDKVCRLNVVEFPVLLAAVRRIDRSDLKFVKNPSTWLNRGCWSDGEVAPVIIEDKVAAAAAAHERFKVIQQQAERELANGSAHKTDSGRGSGVGTNGAGDTSQLRLEGGTLDADSKQGAVIHAISEAAASTRRR